MQTAARGPDEVLQQNTGSLDESFSIQKLGQNRYMISHQSAGGNNVNTRFM